MAEASGTISIGGDVSGLKRALDEGKSSVSSFEAHTRSALAQIDSTTANLGASLKSLSDAADLFKTAMTAIGIAGVATGIFAAYSQLKSVAKEMGEISEDAVKRGVTPEFLQEMAYSAQEFGLKASMSNDVLDVFYKKVTELKIEGSKAARSLEELNAPLLEQIRAASDQKAAFYAVAAAMKTEEDAADRVKLATNLFGSANAEVMRMLESGTETIDMYAEKARRAGVIMGSEATTNARQLTEALREQKTAWEAIIGSMEVWILRQAAVVIGGSLKAMTDPELESALKNTNEQIAELEKRLAAGAKAGDNAVGVMDQLRNSLRAIINDFGGDVKVEILGGSKDALIQVDPTGEVRAKIEELKRTIAEIEAIRAQRSTWKTDTEALTLKGVKAPDTDDGDKWAKEYHGKMLKATRENFEVAEFERQRDLDKFDAFLKAKEISEERAAQARLDIEAKYAAEMRKEFDKLYVQPVAQAISSDLERAFSDWMQKGKFSWQELANSMIADIAKVAMRMAILQPLFGGGAGGGTGLFGTVASGGSEWLKGLVGSAQGNAFDAGNIIPFASGGIVERPSIFAMRDGMGLMGEAGPEAVMPLRRGADGSLGVAAAGGAGNITHVTFNVQTPDAESFRRSQGQLGAQLSRAVTAGNRNR
jgi:hypothetical protein